MVVAHEKIAAFDQLDAHLLGEKHVLEIGAVVTARREENDDRIVIVARRHGAQILQQALWIVADRRNALPGKRIREQPHHDLAVLEHIGDAGGRAHIILEHEEIALAGADQIDAGDMRVNLVRRIDAHHLGPERRVELHQLFRNEARLHDLLVVIDVVEKHIDRLDALDAAALHQLPFGAIENAGNEIEGDQALGRAGFAIDREGDTQAAKNLFGGLLLGGERFQRQPVEEAGEIRVGPADGAVWSVHFVEKFARGRGSVLAQTRTGNFKSLRQTFRPGCSSGPTPRLWRFPSLLYFQAS